MGLAALSLLLVWAQAWYLHVFHPLNALLLVAAGLLLWSVVPRFSRFVPPGPQLRPDEHPALFALLAELAAAAGVEVPPHVYLVMQANAAASVRGWPGRRRLVVILGLPLLAALDAAQLRAVLAHEFGHLRGGDAHLAPLAWRTRRRIELTIQRLARNRSTLTRVFLAYGRLYLRVTGRLSRAQELVADAFAARVAGAAPCAGALRELSSMDGVVEAFWREEIHPVLEAGARPPLLALLQRYLEAPPVREARANALAREEARAAPEPYDSHPVLTARLAALQATAGETAPAGAAAPAPAAGLLDLARAEAALLSHLLGVATTARLRPVDWSDLESAYLTVWRWDLQRIPGTIQGVTADRLPAGWGSLIHFAGRAALELDVEIDAEAGKALAGRFIGAALAIVLHDRGWRIAKAPGDRVIARRGALEVEPFAVLRQLSQQDRSLEDWARFCGEAGIAGVALETALGPPSPAEAPAA